MTFEHGEMKLETLGVCPVLDSSRKVTEQQADSCSEHIQTQTATCLACHSMDHRESEKVKGCGSILTGPLGYGHRWYIISHPL